MHTQVRHSCTVRIQFSDRDAGCVHIMLWLHTFVCYILLIQEWKLFANLMAAQWQSLYTMTEALAIVTGSSHVTGYGRSYPIALITSR